MNALPPNVAEPAMSSDTNERTALPVHGQLTSYNGEAIDDHARLTAESGGLKRGLSARQVQMIAIGVYFIVDSAFI